MKILLVKPKPRLNTILKLHPLIRMEPLELGYIAAAVPQEHEVRILDLRLSKRPDRDFVRTLKKYRPDIIGLSGYTHEATKVIELARTVRRVLPASYIIVGGHHATVLPQDYNLNCFDAIVRGEGCAPFNTIVKTASSGRSFVGIDNVMVPGSGFSETEAAQMPVYPDLSTLPLPRRDLWHHSKYSCIWPSEKHPSGSTIFPQVALVRTSFGCLMNCSFCMVPTLSRRKHMIRPPEQIADEIGALKQKHVYFCDDETFLNEDHARNVAEAIKKRGIKKRYFAWARSTTVNRSPELFRLWREIGLDAVFLGFEAINDADLKKISKNSTVLENEKAHAALREMGIALHAGFMVNANFTREDFRNLQEYMKRMPPAQITCTVYTPSPGSPAWQEEKSRYTCHPSNLHDCMHPMTPTAIPLQDFFTEFSKLSTIGSSRNPLSTNRARFPFRDILRIILVSNGYKRALRNAWRDYKHRG